jgi:hypothetical protein
MKYSREIINGFIIFLGIAIYFLIIQYLGLSDRFYLRVFNILFVVFGINRTIKQNQADGIMGYNVNFLSAIITSMIGAVLSVGALLIYIQLKGGEEFMKSLAKSFIFGGGELTAYHYCIGLFFESVAASFIASFCLMQYWKDKVEVINKVD